MGFLDVGPIMTNTGRFATAGLAFTTFRDLDIVQVANHVVNSLDALGHRVMRTQILSDTRAFVTARDYEVHLAVEEEVALPALPAPVGSYLSVSVVCGDPAAASTFARDAVIARTLQTLHRDLEPDYIKWIDTDVVLTSADFTRATGPDATAPGSDWSADPTPGRATTGRKPLPDIEETNDILQRRLTDCDPAIFDGRSTPDHVRDFFSHPHADPAPSVAEAAATARAQELQDIERAAPRRLSAWLISLAVAVFALPVGVALMVLNLMKGENLRLASQTAALTGTFIALEAYGSTAHAMGLIQGLLG